MLDMLSVSGTITLRLFDIQVITTRSGGAEGVGGIIATISDLLPNTTYLLTIEQTYHIYLDINGIRLAQCIGGGVWNYYNESTNNWINYRPSNTSWSFHVNSDSSGILKIDSWLCNYEEHRYLTKVRYKVTWEEQDVYQQTGWYYAW